MFKRIWKLARKVARKAAKLIKRLIIDAPENEYERLAFTATYSAGVLLRKGLAG